MSVIIRDFDITPSQPTTPAPSATAANSTIAGPRKTPFTEMRDTARANRRLHERHLRVRAY